MIHGQRNIKIYNEFTEADGLRKCLY